MANSAAPSGNSGRETKAGSLTLAAVAAPAMPLAAMTLPLTIFLPEYYATHIGMNLSLVGILFTIVRIADLFFDPLVGNLIDRTSSRFGPYKPWLLFGAPIVMGGAWMLFMAQRGVGGTYLATALIVTYAGYSILTLAQMGLASAVTRAYSERSRVFAWWQLFNMSGILLILLLPLAYTSFTGDNSRTPVQAMGWMVMATAPITVAICLFLVPSGNRPEAGHNISLSGFLDLVRLKSARRVLGSVAMTGLGFGVASAIFVFFFTTVKDISSERFTLMLALGFSVAVISSPFWAWFGNRIGKHRALAVGCIGSALYLLLALVMPPGDLTFMIGIFILNGFSNCAGDVMPRAMIADVSDEDRLLSGNDRTGMLFALLAIVIKLGQAIAIGVVFVALDMIGFDAAAGRDNSAGALTGVSILYCIVPALFQFAAAWFAWRYPLTAERHAEILEELDGQAQASAAPLPDAAIEQVPI